MSFIRHSLLAAATGLGLTAPVHALDLNSPFLCAPTRAQECIETGCTEQSLSAINAPRFLLIDLAKDRIDRPGVEPPRHSLIQHKHVTEQGAMLQGIGDGHSRALKDSGWSLYVSANNEHMVLTVSRPDAAFTFFGHCTNL